MRLYALLLLLLGVTSVSAESWEMNEYVRQDPLPGGPLLKSVSVENQCRRHNPSAELRWTEMRAQAQKGFLVLRCEFTDASFSSADLARIDNLWTHPVDGMGVYFSTVSNGAWSPLNSGFDMPPVQRIPNSLSTYLGLSHSARHNQATTDCIRAYDAIVDFSKPYFIALHYAYPETLSPYSWLASGGQNVISNATQDGPNFRFANFNYYALIHIPQHAANANTVAHEIGHALGLLHVNNSDTDTDEYDAGLDLMSGIRSYTPALETEHVGVRATAFLPFHAANLEWVAPADDVFLSIDSVGEGDSHLFHLTSRGSDPATDVRHLFVQTDPTDPCGGISIAARNPSHTDSYLFMRDTVTLHATSSVYYEWVYHRGYSTQVKMLEWGTVPSGVIHPTTATAYFDVGTEWRGENNLTIRVVESDEQGFWVEVARIPNPTIFSSGFD